MISKGFLVNIEGLLCKFIGWRYKRAVMCSRVLLLSPPNSFELFLVQFVHVSVRMNKLIFFKII
ncbi:hypothetical protein HanPI659440_Chr16g0656201 [Helianthus annuus]|nr:hypothetical protein HanPI659440_Chr16g0656201 [Helianthus annuus]